MIISITILVLLILLTAFITMAESALVSFDSEDVEPDDNGRIKRVEHVRNNLKQLNASVEAMKSANIAAVSLLSVFITILIIIQGGVQLSYRNSIMIYAASVLAVLVVYWVIGVLIPKALGEKYSQKAAPALALPLSVFINIARYPVKVLSLIADLFLMPFKTKSNFSSLYISEERIKALLEEGVKTGAIEEAEHEIIDNVFELNDMKANEVMVPRTEMVAVELTPERDEVFNNILKTGHSLIPIYQESLDNIIGIIHIKDLMRSYVEDKVFDIKTLIRPAYFVPESKLISEILNDMQKRGERITIATDEYGGTEGVITLEDIVGEIVGDIAEAGGAQVKEYSELPDGKFLVLGAMDIDDFNETFNMELPLSDKYNTIAGFISYETGKILNPGERVKYGGIEFELIKKIKQRMVQFKIQTDKFRLDNEKK